MEISTIITYLIYAAFLWIIFKRFSPVKGLKNIDEKELKEKIKGNKSMLIDVREPYEFKNAHIPNAKNIPLSKIKKQINEISVDKEIILYCQSGMRSKAAARTLRSKGNYDISHLKGGIMKWSGNTTSNS